MLGSLISCPLSPTRHSQSVKSNGSRIKPQRKGTAVVDRERREKARYMYAGVCVCVCVCVGLKLTDANVEPIGVVRSKLLTRGGLDGINPSRQLDETDALEMGGVGGDEFGGGHVLDGTTGGSSLHD